ncbi:MAG: ROK family protein [Acidimicrobiales bacterium]
MIVSILLDQGLVEEIGTESELGVGRPATTVRIRPEGALAFGCSIERDRLDGAWVNVDGAPVASAAVMIAPGEEPVVTIRRLQALYGDLLRELTDEQSLRVLPAIGLALPGPIDPVTETLVNPPRFPLWGGVRPRDLFDADWAVPVFVENAATAAALGEAWQSRTNLRNFLYCHWGVGIGGGVVIDLETYRGTSGNAVELGHVPVVPDGQLCDCGASGCVEAEASLGAIIRQAEAEGLPSEFEKLVELASVDSRASALFERAGQLLAQALLGAVNLFDVDAVVIGGHHFTQAATWLLPPVRDVVETRTMRRGVRPVSVTCSLVGEAASAIGAASVVFDRLLPGGVLGGSNGRIQRARASS